MLKILSVAAMIAVVPCAAVAAQDVPTVLRFNPGQTTQDIRGTVLGYRGADYALNARGGDQARIRLDAPKNTSLYFNVISPAGKTIHNGSINGDTFTGQLTDSGTYTVSVYLMRNDARRGKRADFRLSIELNASGSAGGPSRPPLGDGPSFDCRKASGVIETTICKSRSLSQLDARLAFVYKDAVAGAPAWKAAQIKLEQRAWLKSRDDCARRQSISGCLTPLYQTRISVLEPKS